MGLIGRGYSGPAFDGRYIYFAPFAITTTTLHGKVLRCDTTGDFSDVSSWAAYDPSSQGIGYTAALAAAAHSTISMSLLELSAITQNRTFRGGDGSSGRFSSILAGGSVHRMGYGKSWQASRVAQARYYYRLPNFEKNTDWLTMQKAAGELNVSSTVIQRLINEKLLPARHQFL